MVQTLTQGTDRVEADRYAHLLEDGLKASFTSERDTQAAILNDYIYALDLIERAAFGYQPSGWRQIIYRLLPAQVAHKIKTDRLARVLKRGLGGNPIKRFVEDMVAEVVTDEKTRTNFISFIIRLKQKASVDLLKQWGTEGEEKQRVSWDKLKPYLDDEEVPPTAKA